MSIDMKGREMTKAELEWAAQVARAEGRVAVENYGNVYLDGNRVRVERIERALRGY